MENSKLIYHQILFKFLNSIDNYKMDNDKLLLSYSAENEGKLRAIDIKYEHVQNDIRINKSSLKTNLFKSVQDLLSNPQSINSKSDFLILNDGLPISFYDGETYENFVLKKDNYLVSNFHAYTYFQKFLKEKEKESDDAFYFVDSYNLDFRKITFVSLSEIGRLTIEYKQNVPEFDQKIDLSKGFEKFKACFSGKNNILPKFLKSSLIAVATNFPHETRFKQLFESLNIIVDKAQITFDVYLNNLSIDKIKKDYDELKSKYFNTLSDILSKLTNNILALPIAISATLFAIDKIGNLPFFLYFLMAALFVTSIYLSLLLRINYKDLNHVSSIFNNDYQLLLSNNFFIKYPEESALFEDIKKRVYDRIKFLTLIIESYYWVLNLSNIIIIGYILNTLGMNFSAIILFSLGLLVILTFLRNYILEKENINNSE